jgi:hypothetical protein
MIKPYYNKETSQQKDYFPPMGTSSEKPNNLKDLRKKHITLETKLVWIDSIPYGIKVSQNGIAQYHHNLFLMNVFALLQLLSGLEQHYPHVKLTKGLIWDEISISNSFYHSESRTKERKQRAGKAKFRRVGWR